MTSIEEKNKMNPMKTQNTQNKKNTKKYIILILAAIFALYFITVLYRAYTLRKPPLKEKMPVSQTELQTLDSILSARYAERTSLLNPLPYKTKPTELTEVGAKAVIVVDVSNGCILYEKNADEVIPPASMTKLFVMAEVFEEIKKGNLSLDDVIPLVKESFACNMPPHSSLMFLGKNQIVTLKELLSGLAVCSGNDASHAIAYHICGGMEPFIERMNQKAKSLGLTHTHFVETSGYSEQNVTTAREMASFARYYIQNYPESIPLFHSLLSFTYPKEQNLAPEDKGKPTAQDFSEGIPEHITMPIYQKNTNPLLGKLEGCDGLKTGYIDESGYNLALTVKRGNMRILSVTMGGLGQNVQEGQANRTKDGTAITEWAYSTFKDYENPLLLREYSIPLAFAKNRRIRLVPAYSPKALSVPVNAAKNPENALEEVKINLSLPNILKGEIQAGTECGNIQYILNDHVLQTIPLVAEESSQKTNFWFYLADLLAQFAC